ncbi:MAG: S8 family serine peptidase [bacterium]
MKSLTTIILLISTGIIILFSGCGGSGRGVRISDPTSEPEIVEISVQNPVIFSDGKETAEIKVSVSSEGGPPINYAWSSTGGKLIPTVTGGEAYCTFSTEEPGEFTITVTATNKNDLSVSTSTVITSFGPNQVYGGVKGSIIVPHQTSARTITTPTYSGNTLAYPISIKSADESFRDLSRRVVYANKGSPTTSCEGEEFVAGEVILKLNSGISLSDFAKEHGLSIKRESASGIHLVNVDIGGLSRDDALTRTREQCLLLNKAPGVEYAELNNILHSMSIPNDILYEEQWHYPMINLPQAWDITTGSSDVVVAVLDTGIVAGHSDIQEKLTNDGYDFVSDEYWSCDDDGIDSNPEDVADSRCVFDGESDPIPIDSPYHSGYHGTHVAGTIGAMTNNDIGVAGVDWSAKIMPVRVLGAGGGTDYDIIQGIRYAAGLSNDSGTAPSKKADIINMSLGGYPWRGCPIDYKDIFNETYNAGVTVFIAGGNDYSKNGINPLARCNHVMAVAAVNRYTEKACYSNEGPEISIAAPGGQSDCENTGFSYPSGDNVLSTIRDDKNGDDTYYDYYDGTSMATPHAAGVAALMLGANPSLTPDQIAALLAQTATDLGTPGTDNTFGAGLINAYKAVLEAKKLVDSYIEPPNPILAVSTTKLFFSVYESSKSIIITNTGTGTLTVTSVSDTEDYGGDWITTSVESASDKITLTVNINRDGLSGVIYTGKIDVSSNGGSAQIDVMIAVNTTPPEIPPDCENTNLYVVAYDADSFDLVAQTEIPITSDSYSILGLPAEKYYIIAGTDCDDDADFCEIGDYCGAYPFLFDVISVPVSGSVFTDGVNFNLLQLVEPESASAVSFFTSNKSHRIKK